MLQCVQDARRHGKGHRHRNCSRHIGDWCSTLQGAIKRLLRHAAEEKAGLAACAATLPTPERRRCCVAQCASDIPSLRRSTGSANRMHAFCVSHDECVARICPAKTASRLRDIASSRRAVEARCRPPRSRFAAVRADGIFGGGHVRLRRQGRQPFILWRQHIQEDRRASVRKEPDTRGGEHHVEKGCRRKVFASSPGALARPAGLLRPAVGAGSAIIRGGRVNYEAE